MKRLKLDNNKEVLVLTGLIVSTKFIRDVEPILDLKLFQSSYSKKIARWCLDYYKQNNEAPNVHIQDIFLDKVDKDKLDDSEEQIIAQTLDRISTEFDRAKQFNLKYVTGIAEQFFGTENVKQHCKDTLQLLDVDPQKAMLKMEEFKNLKIPDIEGYDVLNSPELMKEAFEQREKPLFKLTGALGKMINPDLCRENFIGILGAEKIGKTWHLLEFGLQACRFRLNVAFFQAGDMTDLQQTARIGIRMAGKSDKRKYCGDILIPILDCELNQRDSCNLKHRTSGIGLGFNTDQEMDSTLGGSHRSKREFFNERTEDGYTACTICKKIKYNSPFKGAVWYKERPKVEPLTWKKAFDATQKFHTKMKGKKMMLHSSSGDLTIDKIESILDHWENTEGFVADVVITDYADLFVNTANDFRHGTNEIWKQHRFLAQKRNCLVITATQADAEAYGKKKLDLSNFSEDKRKYAHVTAFYATSQTQAEKVRGVIRFSHLVVREDDFDSRKEVKVLRSLQTGRPIIASYY